MTRPTELLRFKRKVYQACLVKVEQTRSSILSAIASAEEARDNETKSSVGDKYETGRATMQNEIDRLMDQLANVNKTLTELSVLKIDKARDSVANGCIILTDRGYFFICAGLGKIEIETTMCDCVSPDAPLARALSGAAKGGSRTFNNQTFIIQDLH